MTGFGEMRTRDVVLPLMGRASAEGVRALRERRGWTHEQLADAVHATPLEVAAWEAGTVRVPREQSRHLRELVEEEHVVAAIAAAGLPPCTWAEANAPHLHRALAQGDFYGELPAHEVAHARQCPDCVRIHHFRRQLHVFPTDPGLGFDSPLLRLGRSLDALPRSTLLPLLVAGGFGLVLAAFFLLQGLFSVLPDLPDLPAVPREVQALSWGMVYGYPCFIIASLFVRGLRRRPYVAGLLRALAGVAGGLLAAAWIEGGLDLSDPGLLASAALLVLALGVATGAYARWDDDDDMEDVGEDGEAAGAAPPAPLLADGADALDGVRGGEAIRDAGSRAVRALSGRRTGAEGGADHLHPLSPC